MTLGDSRPYRRHAWWCRRHARQALAAAVGERGGGGLRYLKCVWQLLRFMLWQNVETRETTRCKLQRTGMRVYLSGLGLCQEQSYQSELHVVVCCHRSHVYFRAVLRRRKSFTRILITIIQECFHPKTILNENRQACGPNLKK